MADFYQRFCFTIRFASLEIRDAAFRSLKDVVEDSGANIAKESSGPALRLNDRDGSVSLDAFAEALQKMLVELDLDLVIGFHWASTCSACIPNGFGGGAVVISREEMEWLHADRFVSETMAQLAR